MKTNKEYNALSNALDYISTDMDRADVWGSLMSVRFAIANALARGDHQVPQSWGFRPGASGPEAPEGPLDDCFDNAEPADIRTLGNILKAVTDALDKAGESY